MNFIDTVVLLLTGNALLFDFADNIVLMTANEIFRRPRDWLGSKELTKFLEILYTTHV